MSTSQKILLFFVIPIIAAPLVRPLQVILGSLEAAIIAILVLFISLGFLLLRGNSTALTLSIFLQGLNVITYILMFFPNATYSDGTINIVYIITSLISVALSIYLVLRLDQVDVRTQMVT